MFKFKKDRILLLKELHEIVKDAIEASSIDIYQEEEISDYMIEITDKRRIRKLKTINKEIDKWLNELTHEKVLKEQERLFNESKRKENYVNVAHRD